MNQKKFGDDPFSSGKTVKQREKNTVPAYMKRSVSKSFIQNNPNYKNVFKECPSCGKMSFVNIDDHGRPLPKGRLCRMCNYSNDKVS